MDDVDIASIMMEAQLAADLAEIRERAAAIPVGVPGECDLCGEWSGRLVCGVCAPCRDKHKLP